MVDKITLKKREVKKLKEVLSDFDVIRLLIAMPTVMSLLFLLGSIMSTIPWLIVLGIIFSSGTSWLYSKAAAQYKNAKMRLKEEEKELFFLENEYSLNLMLEKKLSNENMLDLKEPAIEAIKEAKEKDTLYINPDNLDKYSLRDLRKILVGPEPSEEELSNYRNKVYEKENRSEN